MPTTDKSNLSFQIDPGGLCLIPGLGRSPGEGKNYRLQYSGLENSMDCRVHRVAKSRTRLSYFHFHLPEKRFHLQTTPPQKQGKTASQYSTDQGQNVCMKLKVFKTICQPQISQICPFKLILEDCSLFA